MDGRGRRGGGGGGGGDDDGGLLGKLMPIVGAGLLGVAAALAVNALSEGAEPVRVGSGARPGGSLGGGARELGRLRPGTCVVMRGLTSSPMFNGVIGYVESFDAADNRYVVSLGGNSPDPKVSLLKVRAENLETLDETMRGSASAAGASQAAAPAGPASLDCTICMVRAKDHALDDCGHVFCGPCCEELIVRAANAADRAGAVCPVCRARITRKPRRLYL